MSDYMAQQMDDQIEGAQQTYAEMREQIRTLEQRLRDAEKRADMWKETWDRTGADLIATKARCAELESKINTPHTDDWFDAVRLEAAHQIERWGSAHDAGKAATDWFWLIGHLAGKAVYASAYGDVEKAKHHTISSGAALLNWFRQLTGDTSEMRPGIDGAKLDAGGGDHE